MEPSYTVEGLPILDETRRSMMAKEARARTVHGHWGHDLSDLAQSVGEANPEYARMVEEIASSLMPQYQYAARLFMLCGYEALRRQAVHNNLLSRASGEGPATR